MNYKKMTIIIIGDESVGKTSMINSYTTEQFSPDQMPTLGIDFANKTVILKNGDKVILKIMNTAG